jgi:hypothetical protein
MRGGRDAKPQTARVIASSTSSIASASCASREDGEVRETRRSMQPCACPAVDRPRLSSSTARSAARLPPLRPPLRPSHQWPLAEPLSPRPELFSDRSARPCSRA